MLSAVGLTEGRAGMRRERLTVRTAGEAEARKAAWATGEPRVRKKLPRGGCVWPSAGREAVAAAVSARTEPWRESDFRPPISR